MTIFIDKRGKTEKAEKPVFSTWYETIQNSGSGYPLGPEIARLPYNEDENAQYYQSFDAGSAELEYIELLYGLIRACKPQLCLETGTYKGVAAFAMGWALRENGFGLLHTVERDQKLVNSANAIFKNYNLDKHVFCTCTDSIAYCNSISAAFDFVFFDSDISCRHSEFDILYKRGKLKDIVAFHDTSINRKEYIDPEGFSAFTKGLEDILKVYTNGAIVFPNSRGIVIAQIKRSIFERNGR